MGVGKEEEGRGGKKDQTFSMAIVIIFSTFHKLPFNYLSQFTEAIKAGQRSRFMPGNLAVSLKVSLRDKKQV